MATQGNVTQETPMDVGGFLPGFVPLQYLWDGADAPCPSEQAAKWLVRTHQQVLAQEDAIALLHGRKYVHRERFVKIIREAALNAAKQRYGVAVAA